MRVCRKRTITKKHHDPKTEEGRDFKEGKTGRVKAAKRPRIITFDKEWPLEFKI